MRLVSACCLGLVLLLVPVLPTQAQSLPEARGIWIHENHYNDLDATFRALAEAGINIAYLRTWYAGGTVYPSAVVEQAGGMRQHSAFVGRDPIQEAIDVGEKYGIAVGAWMEYGLVAQTIYASGTECPAATGVLAQNPDWSMRDRDGNIAEPSAGPGSLCFYWMDPAHPEVIDFMTDMAAEIAERYPALAIYEADRFRYPSTRWSYSDVSAERYMAETGNVDPRTRPINDSNYLAWRRAQITHLMAAVYRAVKEENPSMAVSAAVVPPYMIGGSQDKMQQWPVWADSGYVDFLEIMLYLNDRDYPHQLRQARELVDDGFPIYAGIDNSREFDLFGQIEETRSQGVEGVIIWDGRGALTASDRALLGSGLFSEPSLPPFDDVRVDDDEAEFAGSWTSINEGHGGAARVLAAGSEGSARFALTPIRDGWYAVEGWWPAREDASTDTPFTITWNVESEEQPLEVTVDQRSGDDWTWISGAYVQATDTLFLDLRGSTFGSAIADAFRLRRIIGFRFTDALITGETTIEVRFNRPVDPDRLRDAHVSITNAAVENVRVKPGDDRLVLIETSPLTSGRTYTLEITDLFSEDGLPLDSRSIDLVADLDDAVVILDDGETGFSRQGSWQTEVESGWNGGGYLRAEAGTGNNALWLTPVPGEGLYSVAVYLPQGKAERSSSAAYLVIHGEGTDTVRVDQQNNLEGWNELGVFRPRNGTQLYVQLFGNLSAPGTIVADAVRWRRTLSPVDAPINLPLEEWTLGAPYPNPARSVVRIPAQLPAGAQVVATIHDALGRQVAAPQVFPPGRDVIEVDVSRFASAVYFIRFEVRTADGFLEQVITKRVAVIR